MAHSEAFYKKPEECHYSFFQHKECEFFPCHKTDRPEDFNCLFCYCPLYALGDKCKGNFRYTENGVKDCSGCMVPHPVQRWLSWSKAHDWKSCILGIVSRVRIPLSAPIK